jgi:hypothetical protein
MRITGYLLGINHTQFLDPATPDEAMSAISEDIAAFAAEGIYIRKVTLDIEEES